MPLSDYWRIRRSRMKDIEAGNVKRAVETMIQALGVDAKVTWGEGSKFSFSSSGTQSGNAIGINVNPIADAIVSPVPGESVDSIMGMVMHESGHQIFNSESVKQGLQKYQPYRKAGLLRFSDVVEDFWVDRQMGKRSLTAGGYIQAGRQQVSRDLAPLVDSIEEILNDSSYAPEIKHMAAMGMFNLMFNYGVMPTQGLDPKVAQALIKIAKLSEGFDKSPRKRMSQITQAYKVLVDILGEPPEDPGDGRQGQGDGQSQSGSGGGNLSPRRDQMEELEKALGTFEEQKGSQNEDFIQEAQNAQDSGAEDLGDEVAKIFGAGGAKDEIYRMFDIREDNIAQQEALERKLEPYKDKLSRVFEVFREVHRKRYRGVPLGKISKNLLWRAGVGRLDIFEKREIQDEVGIAVCLVLDHSGSVHGDWYGLIAPLAAGLAGSRNRNVEIYALGYTTDSRTEIGVMFRPQWGCFRAGDSIQLGFGGTPSAVGLVAAGALLEHSRKVNRLVVHVTDGDPGGVGSLDGYESCTKVTESLGKRGIESVSILVGGSRRDPRILQEAYGQFRTVRNMEEVPEKIEELLKDKATEILGQR